MYSSFIQHSWDLSVIELLLLLLLPNENNKRAIPDAEISDNLNGQHYDLALFPDFIIYIISCVL